MMRITSNASIISKASCLRLALLLNFGGPRLGIKRMANKV